MAKVKIDTKEFDKLVRNLREMPKELPAEMHEEFVKNTPKRSGNARRNTRLSGNTVTADYGYSQKLDEGWSKKAPDGMTKPTLEWLQDEVDRKLKGMK